MTNGRHRALSPPLELTLTEIDDTALKLTAYGHLDADTVDDLSDALQVGLAQPGLTRLLMDFGPLVSIDSAGITVLVAAHQNAQRRGVAMVLVKCSGTVRRSLEITGLYGHLAQSPAFGWQRRPTAATPQPRVPGARQSEYRGPDCEHAPIQAAAAIGP